MLAEMRIDNQDEVARVLGEIVEFELTGVVRYTHYALMVTGPYRIPIVDFMRAQANESLQHALRAGEILTGLGGHPRMRIQPVDESHHHSVRDILGESLEHERTAIGKYYELLELVEGKSVLLEEFARSMVAVEEEHALELNKMVRDLGD